MVAGAAFERIGEGDGSMNKQDREADREAVRKAHATLIRLATQRRLDSATRAALTHVVRQIADTLEANELERRTPRWRLKRFISYLANVT